MNFFISLKLLQASSDLISWGLPYVLLSHSPLFICSACHLFTNAGSFYVRNPRDYLLEDEGSAGIIGLGQGTGRLSDKNTVNACPRPCVLPTCTIVVYSVCMRGKPRSGGCPGAGTQGRILPTLALPGC